jgi:hypothetical protein
MVRSERFRYRLLHSIELFQKFMIPKSQYSEALLSQPGGPLFVMCCLPDISMLTAVHLNYQRTFQANKIDNVTMY